MTTAYRLAWTILYLAAGAIGGEVLADFSPCFGAAIMLPVVLAVWAMGRDARDG